MGLILKLCVGFSLLAVLLLNVVYFCHHSIPLGKGSYFDFGFHSSEPLTILGNGGRLGNQMFVLATLYGLGKLNGRNIALMQKNYEALSPYFDLNFPVESTKLFTGFSLTHTINLASFRVRDPWKIGYWLSEADRFIPATSNVLSGNMYPTSFTFFDHARDEVRRIFRFKTHLQEHADSVLRHVKKLRPWTQMFVCVHVRRGDYLRRGSGGWLRAANGREVDIPYFRKSVRHFRKKYSSNVTTFLAVSDDRDWTKRHLSELGILTLPVAETPAHDLAVLSSCNHTIMTYGTFGFWGGYLAGGEVVYFKDFVKPGGKMAEIFRYDKMYPAEWTGISTTPDGFWRTYTNAFLPRKERS